MVMLMDDAADCHAKYAYNGKVMLGSAILLFLIVLVVIFLHTYGYLCCSHRRRPHRHTLHLNRTSYTTTAAATYDKGLDPSLFKFLPTFVYSSATHRHLQECAVCLSEFEDDDQGRVLPNCSHAFHSHCIDTWFLNHSNCPLCRIPVQPPKISSVSAPSNTEPLFSEREPGQIEEGVVGCSSLPPPIGCPRKPWEPVGLGMVGVIVELPEEEDERWSRSEWMGSAVPGDSGFKGSDNRILSLRRIWSV